MSSAKLWSKPISGPSGVQIQIPHANSPEPQGEMAQSDEQSLATIGDTRTGNRRIIKSESSF